MYNNDTIAAISTPLGCGGLGVIRLSGPRAIETASKIFRPSGNTRLKYCKTHTIHHGWIESSGKTVDEVLVSVMLSPKTYTGEDIVEISAHGGPVILDRILKLCLSSGACAARPGEFTFRAYQNGKMDLAEAEAVADLIKSKTALASQAALRTLKGGLSAKIQGWRRIIIDLLSKLEAKLDYPEEDISFISRRAAKSEISGLIKSAETLMRSFSKGRVLSEGFRIAITGRPNTGKSSLLNSLLERERAIVTDIPGTTRDIIEETLDLRGIPVVVTDTAGLRHFAKDKVEKIGHELAARAVNDANLVLCLVDSSLPLNEADAHVVSVLEGLNAGDKTIILLNKADLPGKLTGTALRKVFRRFPARLRISALTGYNLIKLEKLILKRAHADIKPGEPVILSHRHFEALSGARRALEEAFVSMNSKHTEEITCFHLREALDSLGEITGETATEEILDNIFSKFCVGK